MVDLEVLQPARLQLPEGVGLGGEEILDIDWLGAGAVGDHR